MELEAFAELCKKVFGDKVRFGKVNADDTFSGIYGGIIQYEPGVLEKVQELIGDQVFPVVRIPDQGMYSAMQKPAPTCPNCGNCLFESFEWGIVHGHGVCYCGEVGYQAYHYVVGAKPLVAFAICSISNKLSKKGGYKNETE